MFQQHELGLQSNLRWHNTNKMFSCLQICGTLLCLHSKSKLIRLSVTGPAPTYLQTPLRLPEFFVISPWGLPYSSHYVKPLKQWK